ncbi:hypothetical protein ACFH04_09415 [Streptomyces noboritoensis]|uniref:Lactate/malate dehydrogenase N-terminal domain-containing protein n=1 Tax=Streptomyces noboritoensis TaxID=67337 RepID=A0ABV6THG8_9ACTN
MAARPGARRDGGRAVTGRIGAVGIIGAGAVGHTVATLLTALGWCDRLLVASGSELSATALVTDLEDMREVIGSPVRSEIAAVPAMRVCEAVVVCPRAKFTNTANHDIRMAGLHANAPVIATLGRQLAGYDGAVVVVTNPVDVMTRLFTAASGAPRVFGVGSATDTARYRLTLAHLLEVPVDSVQGQVVGEHGDAAVVCASATRIGGLPAAVPLRAVHDELADRPRRINAGLGRARSGPAGALGRPAGRPRPGRHCGRAVRRQPGQRRLPGDPVAVHGRRPHRGASRPRPHRTAAARHRRPQDPYCLPPDRAPRRRGHPVSHATRISSATRSVTVTSNTASVTDWALSYFGPWWNAVATAAPFSGPVVAADIAPAETAEIARRVADYAHEEIDYANSPMVYAVDGSTVTAVQPGDGLAYQYEPGHLRITGHDEGPVALAAARFARELLRSRLLADGWTILHASAVVRDGLTALALGGKGAGKTTSALLLARSGWHLLANDRVFVRPSAERGVDVLPWPAAAAVVASVSWTRSACTTASANAPYGASTCTPPRPRPSPMPSPRTGGGRCGITRARSSSPSSHPLSSSPGSA